jgi:hypothetical protein
LQAFGIGTDFTVAAGNSWAVFSTKADPAVLYARTNVNGVTETVDLGATPPGLHTYRVQPVAGGFAFSIDGVLKATVAVAIPSGTPVKVLLSELMGTSPLRADWVRTDAPAATQAAVAAPASTNAPAATTARTGVLESAPADNDVLAR